VHAFISLQRLLRRLKGNEAHTWFRSSFDAAVILLDDGVQILDVSEVTHLGQESFRFQILDGLWVRRIFVHRDDARCCGMNRSEGLRKEVLGRLSIPGSA